MGGCQLSEVPGKGDVLGRREVCPGEEHHPVAQERTASIVPASSGRFGSTPRISAPILPDRGTMSSATSVSALAVPAAAVLVIAVMVIEG
jgi:hypothetical protein